MTRNGSFLVATFALVAASLSPPAGAGEIELTPTLAYRSGGFSCDGADAFIQIDPLPVFPISACSFIGAEAEDDVAFGAILGIGIGNGLQVEVLANRQETELRRRLGGIEFFQFVAVPDADLTVTHLQAGLSKTWGSGTVRPFVGAAAGVSRVEADDPALFTDFREDALSASAGVGVKTYLSDRFGLRFEARGYWVDMPRELGGDFTQQDLSVGAILRW